jgi:(R)-2-hydroxyacyl-CoA dehydratese activating ATPase
MNQVRTMVGLDLGHIDTKAVIVKGEEILGHCRVPTGFDVVAAAQTAIDRVLDNSGVSLADLSGIVTTGIFRDVVKAPQLSVTRSLPEYVADARGALFLNNNSRTLIDIGGNIHKAISYDEKGDVFDVIQNDKCADGLGIFYTSIAKAMGLSAQELSESALRSTRDVSVAIQCALSAESEAIDLLCQGEDIADVAKAVTKFIVERVAAMSTCMSLAHEIVVAGGLARSPALVTHLSVLLKEEVNVLRLPEYVGAIGAAVSDEGGR